MHFLLLKTGHWWFPIVYLFVCKFGGMRGRRYSPQFSVQALALKSRNLKMSERVPLTNTAWWILPVMIVYDSDLLPGSMKFIRTGLPAEEDSSVIWERHWVAITSCPGRAEFSGFLNWHSYRVFNRFSYETTPVMIWWLFSKWIAEKSLYRP